MHIALIERTLEYGIYYLGTAGKLVREAGKEGARAAQAEYNQAAEHLRALLAVWVKMPGNAAKENYLLTELARVREQTANLADAERLFALLETAVGQPIGPAKK